MNTMRMIRTSWIINAANKITSALTSPPPIKFQPPFHRCLNKSFPFSQPYSILPLVEIVLGCTQEGGEHVWFTNRTIQRLLRYCSYEFLFDRGIEALSSASFFKISRRSAFSSDIFSSRDPPFQDGINKIINNKNLRLEYANAIKILSKDSWKEDSLLGKLRTTVVDGSCVI